ncbi:MAG: hypothetical protein K2N34_08455 [Lachnospiraceae bacterium]|nr:hypothetical protein [Lachnospiraceae bacterium]
MANIKWKDVAELDFREEADRKKAIQMLKCIKPLSKYKDKDIDVPIDKIEKTIWVLTRKYNESIRFVRLDSFANEENLLWLADIYNDNNLSCYRMYGLSIYELFTKVAIIMYLMREQVGERKEGM